ncbi:hypothetical protein [Clostridium sp. FP1]|nr:hypothetical protein [Clostridium sp. FP1]MBZ9633053.1 hypothetical protein [Clostridium sp. FP1]
MFKRICPKCFARGYSSASTDEEWICEVCKSDIPKSQEVVNWRQSGN